MEMWMGLGVTQQTQEKPGSTVTFPSAVIILLKTTVSLFCNFLWQLEDIQWLIWKTDWSNSFTLEIKAVGKWCSKSVSEVLRMVLIPLEAPNARCIWSPVKLTEVLPCVSNWGCSCGDCPCSFLVTWHNNLVQRVAEQGMHLSQRNFCYPCSCSSGSVLDVKQISIPLILCHNRYLKSTSVPKYLTKCLCLCY